jgi:hypothetical protein
MNTIKKAPLAGPRACEMWALIWQGRPWDCFSMRVARRCAALSGFFWTNEYDRAAVLRNFGINSWLTKVMRLSQILGVMK